MTQQYLHGTKISGWESLYMIMILFAAALASKHFILLEVVAIPFIVYFLLVILYFRDLSATRTVVASPPVIAFFWFVFYFLLRVPWQSLDLNAIKDFVYLIVYLVLTIGMAVVYGARKQPVSFLIFVTAVPILYVVLAIVLRVETSNPLIYGYTLFSFMPFIVLEIEANQRKRLRASTAALLIGAAVVLLLYFHTRTAAFSIIVFGAVMYWWDHLSSSDRRAKMFFVALVALVLVGILVYIQLWYAGVLSEFDSLSGQYFEKGVSGRGAIWPEVLLHILDKPFLGKGATNSTEYYESVTGLRNLSSHNTYLEITFRTGLIGLFFLIVLYYKLFMHFCRHKSITAAKVGGSYLIAAMLFQSSGEYMFFNSILSNVFVWSFLGICIGRTLQVPKLSVK